MTGRSRTYAAAVAVVVLGGVALPASAHVAAPRATVTLQVLPRGQGQIRGGAEVGGQTCTTSSGSGSCAWSAAAGTRVTLTALPAAGASVTWSISDCAAGATTCTFTLDA